MKSLAYILLMLGTLLFLKGKAQEITLRTEYIGKSGYYYLPAGEEPRQKIADSKGSAMIYQGAVKIPLSSKVDEKNRPKAWGIGVGGAYVSLKNQNFSDPMVSEIMNFQIGLYHLRPLNDSWSIRGSLGAGIFSPSVNFSKIGFKNVLASGSIIFIRHLKPDLAIGGGVAINSSLGYPMAFPAVYVKWMPKGKFNINVELVDGLDLSAGYKFNEQFKLTYAFEMNGQVALLKKDDRDVIFSHQYMVTGFRPELKLGEGLTLTGMAGLNLYRPASYSDRTLKGIFASDNDYYFTVSPYASLRLKINFNR